MENAESNRRRSSQQKAEYIKAEREKASQLGCIFNVVALIVGAAGWIMWKWYALPLTVILSVVLGAVYSMWKARQVKRETGLSIEEQELFNERFNT